MENIINLSAHATQSAAIGEWATAMAGFHAELLPIRKDGEAKQNVKGKDGNTYPVTRRYLSLDGILDAVRPILARHGLFVTQELTGSGVATTIFHKSGQFRTSIMETSAAWEGSPMTNSIQNAGGSFTYLKRYALAAALAISADEDSDGADHQPAQKKPSSQQKPLQSEKKDMTPEQVSKAKLVSEVGKCFADINPSEELTIAIYQKVWGVESGKGFFQAVPLDKISEGLEKLRTFAHEYREYKLYCAEKKEQPKHSDALDYLEKAVNSPV